MSESQTRSVAAIGDSCVIPAKAGIQVYGESQNGFPVRGNGGGEGRVAIGPNGSE